MKSIEIVNEALVQENTPAVEKSKFEKGVTTVEYAVMLVLVALAVAAFGTGIAGSVTGVFTRIITALAPAA